MTWYAPVNRYTKELPLHVNYTSWSTMFHNSLLPHTTAYFSNYPNCPFYSAGFSSRKLIHRLCKENREHIYISYHCCNSWAFCLKKKREREKVYFFLRKGTRILLLHKTEGKLPFRPGAQKTLCILRLSCASRAIFTLQNGVSFTQVTSVLSSRCPSPTPLLNSLA